MLCALLAATALGSEAHVVRVDLAVLATSTGVAEAEIRRANRLREDEAVRPGTVVVVPGLGEDHPARWSTGAGEHTVQVPGGGARPPRPGQALPRRTRVCTGPDGVGALSLARTSGGHEDLVVYPDTCVELGLSSHNAGARTSHLKLERGRVWTRSTGGRGSVVLEAGTSVIQGANFRAQADNTGARVEVLGDGVAVISGAATIPVPRGTAARLPNRRAPEEPRSLLSAPRPDQPEDRAELRDPRFSWRSMPEASGYLLELSRSRDFDEPLAAAWVVDPRWRPASLDLPRMPELWWRVAAADSEGLIGRPSEPRRARIPAPP